MLKAKAAYLALIAVQKLQTAAQWALNSAMNANPIGIIIVAITALVGLFVLLYNKCEPFRNLINSLWELIKKVAAVIWEGLCTAFQALVGFIKEISEKVLAFITIFTGPFGFIISIIKELHDNWSAIVETFKTDGIIAGFTKLLFISEFWE